MVANPNPAHITEPMWWFIEEWERMEPATVFAGAWGREKPGYHCDAYGLWWHKDKNGVYSWRGDYSLQLADDKVLGTPLEQFGGACDITFPDAQGGNYTRIRKYSDRIKAAWVARDPRLNGWREVLCNCSDNDSTADGFDIPGHYERTPDDTHKWHIHFSCLRKYLNVLEVFQAMMSILRGETLAQWQSRKDDEDVGTAIWYSQGGVNYWLSTAGVRRPIKTPAEMKKVGQVHRVFPAANTDGFPDTDLAAKGWTQHDIDLTFGPIEGSDGGGTVPPATSHTHVFSSSGTSGPPVPSS